MRRSNRPLLISLAIGCFAIGGYFLFQNLRATWRTLETYPNASFWNVFLSTQGPTGTEPQLVLFVWGPPILVALGVVLLVAHLVGRRMRSGAPVVVGAGAAPQPWQQPQQPQQQAWQPDGRQHGWQQQPSQQPQGWQPQPAQPAGPTQPAGPVQPLGGTQPPPPNAADRIQP